MINQHSQDGMCVCHVNLFICCLVLYIIQVESSSSALPVTGLIRHQVHSTSIARNTKANTSAIIVNNPLELTETCKNTCLGVLKITGLKDIGITTLTFHGHVTSSFDLP